MQWWHSCTLLVGMQAGTTTLEKKKKTLPCIVKCAYTLTQIHIYAHIFQMHQCLSPF